MRTRAEMIDIIQNKKQSVFGSDGVLYTRVSDLPSEATIAKGNTQLEEQTKLNIEAEMKRLQTELEILADKPAAESETAVEEAPKKEETKKEETAKKEDAKK